MKQLFTIATISCSLLCLVGFTACGGETGTTDNTTTVNKTASNGINGLWINTSNGSSMRFKQEGNKITAVYDKPSQKSLDLGFAPGEESIRGTLKGNVITGTTKVRYPEPQKSQCPDKALRWAPFEFFVEQGGAFIKGTWEAQALSSECEILEEANLECLYTKMK